MRFPFGGQNGTDLRSKRENGVISEKLNGFVFRSLQGEEMNRLIPDACTMSVFSIWKAEKTGRRRRSRRKRFLGLQDIVCYLHLVPS